MDKIELSYIAGFLDGDGCIMLQLVSRKDYRLGYEIRPSVVFYQKSKNRNFLSSLKDKLQAGYLRDRKDGMTEYTLVGKIPVAIVLSKLLPFLKLKKTHAELTLAVIRQLPEKGRAMDAETLYRLSKEVDKFLYLNYSKKRKNTSQKVKEFLEAHHLLNPVETDS
jgi:hypothetical protein